MQLRHAIIHYSHRTKDTLLLPFVMITLLLFSGCDKRLDALEQRVATLESATEALRTLYAQGQIITAVTPTEGGYQLTFSNGYQLDIENGITPLLLIDQDDYWSISYDNGATYTRIKDSQGKDIPSGISIRATIDKDGNYVIEHYMPSNPDNVISSLVTPFTSDPAKVLAAITEDLRSHTVTLSMVNGETFTFSQAYTTPTSIALLNSQPIMIGKCDTASFSFRVNPSTATFNYDIGTQGCQIFLDKVSGTRSYITSPTAYSLVRVEQVYDERGIMKVGQYKAYIADCGTGEPYSDDIALVLSLSNAAGDPVEVSSSATRIKYTDNMLLGFSFLSEHNPSTVICDVEGSIDGSSIKVISPYITSPNHLVATFHSSGHKVLVGGVEQESGVTANDFSRPITYRVENKYGEYTEQTVEVIHSGLPILFVDLPGKMSITNKEDWYEGADIRIVSPKGELMYEGVSAIKGRGNSTWWRSSKKPYTLKLESEASILGMPSHRRWVLLSNCFDRTLLRNRVAFELGRCTQLPYTPQSEYVELVLNGIHMGNYLLCEQVCIGENRIDIHPLKATDEDITGGYLLEIDKYYDEVNKFRSEVMDFPYIFKSPNEKELTDAMFDYMQRYINELEYSLYEGYGYKGWKESLDIASFVDFWFAYELTSNAEARHPQSVYLYKDRGRKLCIGPIWDNDWQTFMPAKSNQFYLKNYLYYPVLFEDESFISMVKERWPIAKEKFDTITDFIDAEAQRIKSSFRINSPMWPIAYRTNEDETLSFEEAVDRLKRSFTDKLEWLDGEIRKM